MTTETNFQQELFYNSAQLLRPPKNLTGSEWAYENAWFSTEDSPSKERYSSTNFPFQPLVLDAMTDPFIERVVIMFASQMGKTAMLRIAQGFYISEDPAPIMMVQPTEVLAKSFSKDRFAPFVRDCKILTNLFPDPKSRDSGNTVLHKQFPGGHITFAGANSPANLASRPIRCIFLDETDKYPLSAGIEGDPVKLAMARTRRFWNKKIIMSSTPTITGLSRIAHEFELSNMQYFYVPCPECKSEQVLTFKNMQWAKGKHHNVRYKCKSCGHLITEKEKVVMIRAGKFKATQKSSIVGFHCSEFYVVTTEWGEIVNDFLEAKGKPEQLQVIINTRFAETYDDHGNAPDHLHLYARREDYVRGEIQPGVLFLTLAVDVQEDRLECELRGWGRDEESWSIDHYIFMGNTSQQAVYKNLDDLLARVFIHPNGGTMYIKGLGIDSGDNTQSVYYWCRRQELGRVFALKGETLSVAINLPRPVDIDYQGKRISKGLKLWGVGVSLLKSELYKRLRLEPNDDGTFPGGYIHFPEAYPEEFFKQLTAEALRVREVKGKKYFNWEKTRNRNESLDNAVYNRSVTIILGIERLQEKDWLELERQSSLVVSTNTIVKSRKQNRGRRQISKGIKG